MMAMVPWYAVPGWGAEASCIFSASWCSIMGSKGCDASMKDETLHSISMV